LRPTSFPAYADNVGSIKGNFSLYHVDGKIGNRFLKKLFVSPDKVKKAYTPSMSVYDTYLNLNGTAGIA
jgi:hypothetical protein